MLFEVDGNAGPDASTKVEILLCYLRTGPGTCRTISTKVEILLCYLRKKNARQFAKSTKVEILLCYLRSDVSMNFPIYKSRNFIMLFEKNGVTTSPTHLQK